jgi:hypothetical protein
MELALLMKWRELGCGGIVQIILARQDGKRCVDYLKHHHRKGWKKQGYLYFQPVETSFVLFQVCLEIVVIWMILTLQQRIILLMLVVTGLCKQEMLLKLKG